MAIINSEELPVTKNGHDINEAQQTADEAKQETIEINKTLTEVDKRVSEAQSKADESLEKAQEGFDKGQEAIDSLLNLKIGSNNLLPNSSFKYNFDNWEGVQVSPYFIRDAESDYPSASILEIVKTTTGTTQKASVPLQVKNNTTYTISFDIKLTGAMPSANTSLFVIRGFENKETANSGANATKELIVSKNNITSVKLDEWFRVSVNFITNSDYLRVIPYNSDATNSLNTQHRRLQVEEGNVSTDWSESSADIDKAVLLVDNKTGVIAGRVTDAEGKITTLTATAEGLQTEVKSKADSSTVTQLANVVASKVSNTDFESNKTQTAELISASVKNKADSSTVTQLADVVASKVSNTDFESNKTQTAELINSTVEAVTIGESNYLYDSNFKSGAKNLMATSSAQARTFWRNSSTNGTIKSIVPMIENGFTAALKFKSAGTGQHMVAQDFIPCKKNQSIVLSGWFKAAAAGQGIQVQVGQGNAASDLDTYKSSTFVASKADTWQKFEFVKVTDADTFTGVFLGGHNQIASEVWFANVKLEKGEKSTPWSESDFELASQSQISQLADNINLKVDTGDVINQINIDPKGIIISGKKISLDGDVRVLPGFKLKADVFEGETFRGNSFIKAIDLKNEAGHNVTGESSIDDEGIIITQKTKDPVSGANLSETRSILNNGINIGTPLDYSNGDKSIDYKKEYSQLGKFGLVTPNIARTSDRATPYWNGTGVGDFSKDEALKANGITPNATHFYIGVPGEVRIVDEKGNTPAGLTYKNIRANSFVLSGNEAFTSASGYAILRGATDNDIVYLQGSEVRVTAHASGGTYRPIRASAFTVSSSRDVKKNIEDWTGDALELVNGTRVTQYNLNDEDEDVDYKRIGLIVQESPLEIINFNGGDSIDLYEMASILWKSVQELDAKNKVLEKEKNNLDERLSKIEGLLNLD